MITRVHLVGSVLIGPLWNEISQMLCNAHRQVPVRVAAPLLGLWVRIPPGSWVFVSLSAVCLQVQDSAYGWSLVQRRPTECGVSNECDREAPSEEAMTWNRVEVPQKVLASGNNKVVSTGCTPWIDIFLYFHFDAPTEVHNTDYECSYQAQNLAHISRIYVFMFEVTSTFSISRSTEETSTVFVHISTE
jgi:hypothetical protein